jgi:hypothetical protein
LANLSAQSKKKKHTDENYCGDQDDDDSDDDDDDNNNNNNNNVKLKNCTQYLTHRQQAQRQYAEKRTFQTMQHYYKGTK